MPLKVELSSCNNRPADVLKAAVVMMGVTHSQQCSTHLRPGPLQKLFRVLCPVDPVKVVGDVILNHRLDCAFRIKRCILHVPLCHVVCWRNAPDARLGAVAAPFLACCLGIRHFTECIFLLRMLALGLCWWRMPQICRTCLR